MKTEKLPFAQLSTHIKATATESSDWIAVQSCKRALAVELGLVIEGEPTSVLLTENDVQTLIDSLRVAKNYISKGE